MRIIKFRGKPVKNFGEDIKWVYGSLIIDYEAKLAYIQVNDCEEPVQVEWETVGQYIGLPDRNKKEIYEDDLLEIQNGSERFIARVMYKGSAFALVDPEYHNTLYTEHIPYYIDRTGEVIGNIHDK